MSQCSAFAHVAPGLAAVGAGAVKAMAGGGTLISFPVMTARGVPAVQGNATNSVALCPGYVGGTYAQRRELDGLAPTLKAQLVVAAVFGLAGSVVLTVTSEAVFRSIVPFLILLACGLLAIQDRLRTWLLALAAPSIATVDGAGRHRVGSMYGGGTSVPGWESCCWPSSVSSPTDRSRCRTP